MGILVLNKLIKNNFRTSNIRCFNHIVIDGSNLMVISLSRYSGKLREIFELPDFWFHVLPDANLFTQMAYIVTRASDDIVSCLTNLLNLYEAEDVYFVLDPPSSEYIFNKDMFEDGMYMDLLFQGDDYDAINDGKEILLTVKSEEQEKRRKCTSKVFDECVNDLDTMIGNEYSIDDVDRLHNLTKQLSFFRDVHNTMQLRYMVIDRVMTIINENEEYKNRIHFIQAEAEADLIIKNLANDLNGDVLIISTDTDYDVLAADLENVYVCSEFTDKFKRNIYYPYEQWKEFFEMDGNGSDDTYSESGEEEEDIVETDVVNNNSDQISVQKNAYEYVIRLAPLCGNDYTAHIKLLDANNTRNVKCLFNVNRKKFNIHDLSKISHTNIVWAMYTSTINNIHSDIDNSLKYLDEMVRLFDSTNEKKGKPKFFSKYYMSVLIYKSWKLYDGKWNEMKPFSNDERIELYEKSLWKILSMSAIDLDGSYKIYSSWNSELFRTITSDDDNWNDFIKSIHQRTFKIQRQALRYYLKCEKSVLTNDDEECEEM